MPLGAQQVTNLSDSEAEAIATEAYIYGYPLITMDTTRRVMTNAQFLKQSCSYGTVL